MKYGLRPYGEEHRLKVFVNVMFRGTFRLIREDWQQDFFSFFFFFFSMAQQPRGLLIVVASRSHSGTPQPVGLLQTSDRPDAETSI